MTTVQQAAGTWCWVLARQRHIQEGQEVNLYLTVEAEGGTDTHHYATTATKLCGLGTNGERYNYK